MRIVRGVKNYSEKLPNPVLTLGNFDGVHLGHQAIFKKVVERAREIKGTSIAFTFEPHPLKVISPAQFLPLLTPFRKKMMLIEKSGIEKVLCIKFSLAFAEISPPEFVRNILVKKVNAKKIIVGYNYHFGKGKTGDVEILRDICKLFNIGVEVMEALTIDHTIVSSSKIRELIRGGEVEKASKLLGRNYPIIGRVVGGKKRGHVLGFPTANLEILDELYPKTGVYAVEVVWMKQSFKGLANLGFNPTFPPSSGGEKKGFSLEVHLLNFNQEIYGEEIQVNFKKRIRDEMRFDSPSHLIDQVRKDIRWAEENVFTPHP
jgi:riboflavin kinase/FMN adenylyltransferase